MAILESSKVMYEIYQEAGYNGRYRVVYFTELNDHNKEFEISRALAGRHVYDGFISDWKKHEAKQIIARFVGRLNDGEKPGVEELEEVLREHAACK